MLRVLFCFFFSAHFIYLKKEEKCCKVTNNSTLEYCDWILAGFRKFHWYHDHTRDQFLLRFKCVAKNGNWILSRV